MLPSTKAAEAHEGGQRRRFSGVRARRGEPPHEPGLKEPLDVGLEEASLELPCAVDATRIAALRGAVGAEQGHDVCLSVVGDGFK